jgi:spore coat protein SA
VTPGAYPLPAEGSGSVERVVEKTTAALAPHIDTYVFSRSARHLPSSEVRGGVKHIRFPGGKKSNYLPNVIRSLRQLQPDVIQVENRPRMVPSIKSAMPHTRVWLQLHSNTFLSRKEIKAKNLKLSLSMADKIIVNSEFLGHYVIYLMPQIAHKVQVNYPGVDISQFHSQYSHAGSMRREALRARLGWSQRRVVLFMGRLIPDKGVHHLLNALPDLVRNDPQLLLVIVGGAFYGSKKTTQYARSLKNKAARWRNHVQFVSYVPHGEVPSWFLAADVAVVPSSGREAFGLVNVEAMATGLPVVATRVGGIKEVVNDGYTGYLVDPNNIRVELIQRLLMILRNDTLRTFMGMASRKRVEDHFTWGHTAQRWLKMLAG